MVTGQEIIDFIHNCKLEDAPITRTCDELIFSKCLNTGNGTYEETSLQLNLQSGMYYKVNHSRKIYEYMEKPPKTEKQVKSTAATRQKKSKDDDISTYQEYSYIRHPDRVEMGTY